MTINSRLFALRDGVEEVGLAVLDHGSHELGLYSLWVLPRQRHRGYGCKALLLVSEAAREGGFKEREKDRREELERQIQAWSRAHEVRAYVAVLQPASQDHVLREPDGRLARWLHWAQTYAEQIDPLADVRALPLDPEGFGKKPLELGSQSWAD